VSGFAREIVFSEECLLAAEVARTEQSHVVATQLLMNTTDMAASK
jgi:hypothetical protein